MKDRKLPDLLSHVQYRFGTEFTKIHAHPVEYTNARWPKLR